MGFFSWLFKKKPRQIKLGIALGSGGAKGFASLGALRAFEENDLNFDIVTGTSIGSIIGAFYSNGYTSTDIGEMLKRIKFGEIANMFMLKIDMSSMANIIDRYIGSLNIEDLKKPFNTVATDFETGEEKVLDSGNVAIALCASSSMPPFFKPVEINGRKYIDGAYVNSIPADRARILGADYVVGIDLSTETSKKTIFSKLFPTYQGKVEDPKKKGYENSNVVIHPDLTGYSATSFSEANEMYEIGYQSAIAVIPQIKQEIEKLKKQKPKKNVKKN